MKKITLVLCIVFCAYQLHSQAIFDDTVHTATAFGNVNSPGGEGPQQIIDQNDQTKFLDFNAGAGFDGLGFEVNLNDDGDPNDTDEVIATSIRIVTANDASERDPMDYEIFGSNNGTDYTSITTGNIPCVTTRFLSRTYNFTNTTAYSYYRLVFTNPCGVTNIIQVADVQLFGTIGNPPVINCPGDIVINNTSGQCDGIASFTVTANDAEDGALTPMQTLGLPSGSAFPVGVTNMIFSVSDMDGNIVNCDFTVTVNDNEFPEVTCPSDITVNLANDGDSGIVVDYTVTSTDNCSLINPLTGFTPLINIAGKAYYVSDNTFTGANAFADATAQGGFVGTIRDSADNLAISNALAQNGILEEVFIGFNDNNTEGNFEWQSGDASTYDNWNAGEPNNAGNEDYTVLNLVDNTDGRVWNDVTAIVTHRYLLELDYVPVQTAGLSTGSEFPLGTTTNTFDVYDIAGNTDTCSFDVVVNPALSIDEKQLNDAVSIYPNPSDDKVTITNSSGLVLQYATIYDISGRVINTIDLSAMNDLKTIDISNLKTGLYLIKIEGQNQSTIKRMLKK